MAVIVLKLDDFKTTLENRPKTCLYCGSSSLQGWGTGTKSVLDTQPEVSEYRRFRCNTCQRTFRYYVAGVDRTRLTQRIRKIAGMSWALGLSAREVVEALRESGVALNYMTVWREGNDLLTRLKEHLGSERPGRYSIDKEFLKIKACGIGTAIMVDLGGGKTVVLGRLDEVNYRKVLAWLEPIVRDLDIQMSLVGTDTLFGKNLT